MSWLTLELKHDILCNAWITWSTVLFALSPAHDRHLEPVKHEPTQKDGGVPVCFSYASTRIGRKGNIFIPVCRQQLGEFFFEIFPGALGDAVCGLQLLAVHPHPMTLYVDENVVRWSEQQLEDACKPRLLLEPVLGVQVQVVGVVRVECVVHQ